MPVLLQRPPHRSRDGDAATIRRRLSRSGIDARRVTQPVGDPGADELACRSRRLRRPSYVLGYGADLFGIWDRQAPGSPAETFPRTDEGWRNAWVRFVNLEPNNVPVGAGQGSTSPSGMAASPTGGFGMQASPGVPDPSDDQVLQYTHSGSTYLLGYGRTFFGIWQRSDPTRPVERFPRDDDGWATAWRRFTAIEATYAEVGLGPGAS